LFEPPLFEPPLLDPLLALTLPALLATALAPALPPCPLPARELVALPALLDASPSSLPPAAEAAPPPLVSDEVEAVPQLTAPIPITA